MSDVKSPTEIRFYHLQRMPVERALGMILQRIMDRGQRALVYGGLPEHLASLDKALWAGNPNGFLPHGLAGDAAAARPAYARRCCVMPTSAIMPSMKSRTNVQPPIFFGSS